MTTAGHGPLRQRLRLMVLTEPRPAGDLPEVVRACVNAGATAIQLRDKTATGRELFDQACALRPVVHQHDALLIVNDRLDVALAAAADGVHLGSDDLPVGRARSLSPPDFLIGYSTDEPEAGRRARDAGADYLGVGAVFGTQSKQGLDGEAIGTARIAEVMRGCGLPAVGIGGITPENAAEVVETGAGLAVLSAVMRARSPGAVVRRLLELLEVAPER